MQERAGERIVEIGKALFNAGTVDATISAFEDLFSTLGSPVRCPEISIDSSKKDEIRSLMKRNQAGGIHHTLSDKDREMISNLIFN